MTIRILLIIFGMANAALAQISAELSETNIPENSTVELKVVVSGEENAHVPEEVKADGLQIRLTGQSTQSQMVNFKIRNSISFSYVVYPLKSGIFIIPPINITSNGKDFFTEKLRLTVAPKTNSRSSSVSSTYWTQPTFTSVANQSAISDTNSILQSAGSNYYDKEQAYEEERIASLELQNARKGLHPLHIWDTLHPNISEEAARAKRAKEEEIVQVAEKRLEVAISHAKKYRDEEMAQIAKQQEREKKENIAAAYKAGEDVVKDTLKEVKDTEPEKYGGPSTKIVIQLSDGGSESQKNKLLDGIKAQTEKELGINIKEIKRGNPLRVQESTSIPAGTTLFPIRLVCTTGAVGDFYNIGIGANAIPSTLNVDLYFYKDEFGDWASYKKNGD